MRRTPIIAAAIGSLLVASSSFAAFTFTQQTTVFNNAGGVAQATFVDIFAQNDVGGDDGNAIQASEINYAGNTVRFNKPNGAPVDLQNNLSGNSALAGLGVGAEQGFIRNVGAFPEAGQTPALNDAAWGSLNSFSIISAVIGTAANANNPIPIVRLAYPVGVEPQGVLSGFIGGEIGSKVPFSINIGGTTPPVTNNPVIVNDGASTNVVFGQIVSNGAPFSIVINATDLDAGDVLQLAVGALPAGISNVTVSPATSGSPAAFTIAGTVDYSLNQTTVNVPINVTSTSGSATGSFSIVVTPEPASLGLIGLSSLFLGRRRK